MDAEALYQEGLVLEREAEQAESDPSADVQTRYQRGALCRKKAAESWKAAAELGHARAQYKLGLWYMRRSHKENGANRAFYWFHQAARQGDADAQAETAACYAAGSGTAPDRRLSQAWYTEAAEHGHCGAAMLLGERCRKRKRYHKAAYWFSKAAEGGAAAGMAALGELHEKGLGVSADLNQAASYYRSAARAGHPGAAAWLKAHGLRP